MFGDKSKQKKKVFKDKSYAMLAKPGYGNEDKVKAARIAEAFTRSALRQGFDVHASSQLDYAKANIVKLRLPKNISFSDFESAMQTVSERFNVILALTSDESIEGEKFSEMENPSQKMLEDQILLTHHPKDQNFNR